LPPLEKRLESVFHISACPVCSGTEFNLVTEARDWLVTKEGFSIYSCTQCGFRFTQDAPDASSVGRYYDDEKYVEHSDSSKGLIFTIYHQARKLMLSQKHRMLQKISKGKSLLDVGSGSGYFLNYMQNRGYDCLGVEISENARRLSQDKLSVQSVHPDKLINKEIPAGFDLITLWHVFEHVYTYDEYFDAFDSLLSEGGRLVIAMPNFHCLEESYYGKHWNGYDVPRHLWHFDIKTFSRFAKARGFEVEKTMRLPLDPFYNSMVSAEYKPNYTFLPWVVFVGFLSFLNGILDKNKASSVVYVLKKTN
jgi:SAM-dependent methyltransferase